MKLLLPALLIAASLPCAAQQAVTETPPPSSTATVSQDKSLADIRKRFATMTIKALEDYVAANPNAGDVRRGLMVIFDYYLNQLEDREKALSTLDRITEYLVSKTKPRELRKELQNLYEYYVKIEARERAIPALERGYALLAKGADSDLEALGATLYSLVFCLTESESPDKREKAKALVAKARKELAGHADPKGVAQVFAKLEGLINPPMIGTAPEITFTALDGSKVNLADMKGKVVLVDFWTIYGPSSNSILAIKAPYDKFHAKGFEVISISLDDADARTFVENFVKDQKLPWPQSFEGKGWDHPLAITFGIRAVPATFLIGKDGKIIEIGSHGEALNAKLAELLK